MSDLNGRVVALLNQKGGVGKTTMAVHIAHAWAREGRAVTLHDTDEQRSALDYAAKLPALLWKDDNTLLEADPERLTVVDTPPTLGEEIADALRLADAVVVPINDWQAVRGLARLLATTERARVANPNLQVILCPVMADDTIHWRETEAELRRLFGARVLSITIPRATAFREAARNLQTLFDFEPRHPTCPRLESAAREIASRLAKP